MRSLNRKFQFLTARIVLPFFRGQILKHVQDDMACVHNHVSCLKLINI